MYRKISPFASSIIYSADVKHKSNTTKYIKKGRTKGMVPITKYEQEQDRSGKNTLWYSFGLAV